MNDTQRKELKLMLEKWLKKYNAKFSCFAECSSVGSDGTVAVFKSNRKIWEGHIYPAIDYFAGFSR